MIAHLFFLLLLLILPSTNARPPIDRGHKKQQSPPGNPTGRGIIEQSDGVFELKSHAEVTNSLYTVEVSVGTPPKSFLVTVDTSSRELWLPAVGCEGFGSASERLCSNSSALYEPFDSRTAEQVAGGGRTENEWADPTYITGLRYRDVVAFGNARSAHSLRLRKPAVFGAADLLYRVDRGVLGLGLSAPSDRKKSLVEEAFGQGLLARPLFTLFFAKCPQWTDACTKGGVLTLGGCVPFPFIQWFLWREDHKNCGPVLGWAPAFSAGGSWQLKASGLAVGRFVHRQEAIVSLDSKGPSLLLPARVLNGVLRAVGARPAKFLYFVDCKRDALTNDFDGEQCVLDVGQAEGEEWVFGTPFFRAVCTVHDFQQRRIGFALPKP
ncbi:Peptidase A1 domain-containing protein [Aphelenchoides fujianensis]|nr:Peptidase A1 domain-containing protein [Aphelenchoides fujianensis]